MRSFERLAALEGADACVATASGMVTILDLLALLKGGDHIVSSRSIFGATVLLFNNYLGKLGIGTSYVPLTDCAAWERPYSRTHGCCSSKPPSNPLMEIADIARLAKLAHSKGCLLAVDNVFCRRCNNRSSSVPTLWCTRRRNISTARGAASAAPSSAARCEVGKEVYGSCAPAVRPKPVPRLCFKGLETLAAHEGAQRAGAGAVAGKAAKSRSAIVLPGLASHPQHTLAKTQQSGFGGIVSFEVEGGQAAAWRVIDSTRVISITANLGDAKSTITHPAPRPTGD